MFRYVGLVLTISLFAHGVEAKRDFFVEKEVRCGVGGVCYLAKNGSPLNGKLRSYTPSGVVDTEAEYKNGVRHGIFVHYYPDGKHQVYMIYKNGFLDGVSYSYYPNGNIKYKSTYVAGVLQGANFGYYKDGAIRVENTYVNGVLQGRERRYYPDGKVLSEINFDDGKPVRAICYKADSRQQVDFLENAERYVALDTTPCSEFLHSGF